MTPRETRRARLLLALSATVLFLGTEPAHADLGLQQKSVIGGEAVKGRQLS